jgi:MFS family permease
VVGQLVVGMLLALDPFGLTWRSVFLVNVPIGIVAAIAAARVLREDERDTGTRLDGGGVILIGLALLFLSVPLLLGRDHGWPAWMLTCLVVAAPAFAVFVAYERRLAARGGAPLVRIELFRNSGFAGGIPIAMLFIASYAAFLLTLAIYLQTGLGFSPLHAGAVYTQAAVGFFFGSLTVPKLVPLLGRHVLSADT